MLMGRKSNRPHKAALSSKRCEAFSIFPWVTGLTSAVRENELTFLHLERRQQKSSITNLVTKMTVLKINFLTDPSLFYGVLKIFGRSFVEICHFLILKNSCKKASLSRLKCFAYISDNFCFIRLVGRQKSNQGVMSGTV